MEERVGKGARRVFAPKKRMDRVRPAPTAAVARKSSEETAGRRAPRPNVANRRRGACKEEEWNGDVMCVWGGGRRRRRKNSESIYVAQAGAGWGGGRLWGDERHAL